ncbi:MAG: LytTR family DNA-binding domain-containing protein [Rhodothermaceae bacterium]|nr:LytTR family DNA-binding domain-containing protein [Rhodothermaceae bacterium]
MMKIAIIEDEVLAADRLEEMILEIVPDSQIVARCGSVRESVSWLLNNTADLIFLDIQLSDGLSFSIFDRISISTPVIFTTAYDQYAIKAFELNSISYLLKPIRKSDLEDSVRKYQSMKSAFSIDFDRLLAGIRGEDPGYKKRFLIRVGEKLKKVETTDIAYFYALEKSVFCRTFKNKMMPVDYTLDALESLIDPALFFRINRKYIVNLEAIDNMLAWSRSRIKLELTPPVKDGDDTIVSIERAADFKKWMNS